MSNVNPYAPTMSDVTSQPSGMRLATQGKRFLTYIIDTIVMYMINFGIGLVAGIALAANGDMTPEKMAGINLGLTLFGVFMSFLYYVVMEASTGRTIGKFVMGTRVVNESGGPASVGQVLGRSLCRFIPFEPFSFLFGGNTKFPVGWHDSLPKTRVVMAQ